MLPRRSSTNSQRRSSILKPPKSRQPFQDLDFNTSSPENSPNSTKKRRVSFAEKKHVKEFCDHKEQGTIWDSTYEEPDQSASRSTEVGNENGGIKSTENVDIEKDDRADSNFLRDNQNLLNSEGYVIMDPDSVENTSRRVFFDSENELDITDVIPCSRGFPNDSISRTIFCPDVELEITEAIGGIEPTVSVKTIGNTQPREIKDCPTFIERVAKDPEHTMLFESSGGEMMFTEVIRGGKSQPAIHQNFAVYQDSDKSNSLIENQTIIFEDSIMELTLTKSQTEVDLDVENNVPRAIDNNARNEKVDLESNEDGNYCGTPHARDKTLFFNDFTCDMTEAVNTVIPRLPTLNLTNKEPKVEPQIAKDSGVETCAKSLQDANCSMASEGHDSSKESDTHGNETIFFSDFGCEITGAISTLKTCVARDDENVERNDAEQIVPQQSIPIDRVTNTVMEVEPEKHHSVSSNSKPAAESLPKLISEFQNRTEFFNDSAMDFTTAITRKKNERIEEQESGPLGENRTAIFDDCDVDVTEDARATLSSLNSGSNSEERDQPLSNELENTEVQNTKKRKSIELEADVNCCSSSNSSMNKNAENDLVQSLVRDESNDVTSDCLSNTFAQNCKRLKVMDVSVKECRLPTEDDSVIVQSVPLENVAEKTIEQTPPNTQDTEILLPENVATEKDRISSLGSVESTEEVSAVAASNSCNDYRERTIIDDHVKGEDEESEQTTENDVIEEETSFLEAEVEKLDSDWESEVLELSRIYDKQQKSMSEKSNDVQSRLEPDECLENNDDCCFVMFSEELEKHSKSEDCIWTIRSVDKRKVLIDFISKSLVVVIHLESTEEITSPRIINDIQIISLLPESSNEYISMVHDILLKKLDLDHLKRQHRTTQDVLPLLELISQRVKLLLDFIWEFEKLEDLHLINRSGNRISFRLHSYKVQLVIKITIDLEPLENIGPNDVGVECVLGNIREKDIKQLITSVKKDHRFLTNYINDVKEYIALVAEK